MASISRVLLISLFVCVATCRVVNWAGGATRDDAWSEPANWNPKVVPTRDDDVVIAVNKTFTIYVFTSDPPGFAKTITFKDSPYQVQIAVFAGLTVQAVKGGVNATISVFSKVVSNLGVVEIGTLDIFSGRANVSALVVPKNVFLQDGELFLGGTAEVGQYFFFENSNLTANTIKTFRTRDLFIYESFITEFTATNRAEFRQSLLSRHPAAIEAFRQKYPAAVAAAAPVVHTSILTRINLVLTQITIDEYGGVAENNEVSLVFAKGSSVTTRALEI